jgi:quercetin dioxygenase-like cupin family protein
MDDTAAATTTGVAQHFDLHALKAFSDDKRVRKMLFKTDQLWSEIACYEPGQSTVMHSHPREEEAIYVVEGTVNMNVGGEEIVAPAGSLVKFPNAVPHDVRNLTPARAVIMFLKVNPKVLKGGADG